MLKLGVIGSLKSVKSVKPNGNWSLRSLDWNALQTHFRQQYSKFGSSKEQYFHVWGSFHYDENEDTIDSYILKVKQVASLLNYGEPEILELFINTLPSKLYWILFPINNL